MLHENNECMNDSELRSDIRLYLTFLQNTITRMGDYGKTCKQISITLFTSWLALTGIFTQYCKLSDMPLWLIILPILSFWFMDAFFLKTERLYRSKYNYYIGQFKSALKNNISSANDIIEGLYDMNLLSTNKKGDFLGFWPAFFSKTLLFAYLFQIILAFIYLFF